VSFDEVLQPPDVHRSLCLQPSHEHRAKEHDSAGKLGLVADKSAAVVAELDDLKGPPRRSPAHKRLRRASLDGRWRACGGAPQRRVGGVSRVTQPVLGALGVERKEASTRCAQRDLATGSCPTPGMATTVELGSVRAASRA
jgi:hypothetical protein